MSCVVGSERGSEGVLSEASVPSTYVVDTGWGEERGGEMRRKEHLACVAALSCCTRPSSFLRYPSRCYLGHSSQALGPVTAQRKARRAMLCHMQRTGEGSLGLGSAVDADLRRGIGGTYVLFHSFLIVVFRYGLRAGEVRDRALVWQRVWRATERETGSQS